MLSTFRRHFNIFKNRNSWISCLLCYPLNYISDENGFKSLVGTCCNLCFMTRHFLTSFLISLSYILSQQQSMISIWWQSALSVVHVYVEKALIIVCLTNISSFENVTVICPSSPVFIPLKTQVINDLWIIPKDYFSDLFWLLTATLNILNNKIYDNFGEKNAFGMKTKIKVYNTYIQK